MRTASVCMKVLINKIPVDNSLEFCSRRKTRGLAIFLDGPSLKSQHILLKAPLSTVILLPRCWQCQGDCLPRGELWFWQGSLAGSWKRHLHSCSSVNFLFLSSVKYNIHTQCLQHAPFILKGKRMINTSTSYCPHFVNSLAHIFLLFTVKPENGNAKGRSSPILRLAKLWRKISVTDCLLLHMNLSLPLS